jgi:hypothetical protein
LLTPSKSRFSIVASWEAHRGPCFTISISHLSGFPSAAKNLGAFVGGEIACAVEGEAGVEVPAADPVDDVEVLMPDISPETLDPNKPKVGPIWRMIDQFDLNDDPKGRIIDIRHADVGESWRKFD